MNENKQNTALVTVIAVATLLVAVVGATFAYFTATSTSGSTSKIEAKSGVMTIAYSDKNSTMLTKTDFQPGTDYIAEKSFSITGTNTATGGASNAGLTMPFTVDLEYTNGFTTGQIHYYIKRTDNATNAQVPRCDLTGSVAAIPGHDTDTGYTHGTLTKTSTATQQRLASGYFAPGVSNVAVSFDLKLQFPDTGDVQDENFNAVLQAKVVINADEKANAGTYTSAAA